MVTEGQFHCLDISPVRQDDGGLWSVKVANIAGTATSSAQLTLGNEEIKAGDVLALTPNASDPTSLGLYTCLASNCMGSVESTSVVHIDGSPASVQGHCTPLARSGQLVRAERRSCRNEQVAYYRRWRRNVRPAYQQCHRRRERNLEMRKGEREADASPAVVSNGQALSHERSLSTIHEERTSQMHDTDRSTIDDRAEEVSFSFDGKEVSVSLYETPDLTEEEALQIVEMYADQISEHVTGKIGSFPSTGTKQSIGKSEKMNSSHGAIFCLVVRHVPVTTLKVESKPTLSHQFEPLGN
ncbi:unnamed protein product [Nesidiocoris tenuis]|uniref:Ig-like domain-containing protein n=1 Tax=Nesidiocoris tenuis TaxID=355587 RepID=A0A6H5G3C0_9HEMI|nr:unnamed protein product [Nesidiocoris tenuis]